MKEGRNVAKIKSIHAILAMLYTRSKYAAIEVIYAASVREAQCLLKEDNLENEEKGESHD